MAAFLLLPAAASAEEETHLFNATLSLTGDCTTATIDPVPDPGCPGGAHPPKPFAKHGGVAVDLYGNRYVASAGPESNDSHPQGRIDVFDSSGGFITEIPVALGRTSEASLAVDSQGYLYVGRSFQPETERLLRYKPTKYNSAAGEIEYGAPPVAIPNPTNSGAWNSVRLFLAVNPVNDHLFVGQDDQVTELGSAAEENVFVEIAVASKLPGDRQLAMNFAGALTLDSVRKRIYVSDLSIHPIEGDSKPVVKVFDLEAPPDPEEPRETLFTIDGSTTPTERFVSETRTLPVAVDEASGHVFVGDLEAPTRRVYEFDAEGNLISTIEAGFKSTSAYLLQLAYDDGATSPTEGYLFVPSHSAPGRSLAFEPKPIPMAPEVEALSVSGVTTEEAILQGKVNPKGQETSYRFEYTSEQAFGEKGFEGATLAGEGTLKPASEGIAVSAPVSGLQPGTAYRFRLLAESVEGEAQADASFATYTPSEISGDCPNQALRSGPSAALPDCRAYELVTPADSNGHPPIGTGGPFGIFTNRQVSPAGDKLPFNVEGGSLPGLGGLGSFFGDPYLASRSAGGWTTTYTGPSGAEAIGSSAGTTSPDQGHSFWMAEGSGPAVLGEMGMTSYVRYPDGHSEVLGQGSLGVEPEALGKLISEGGGHIVFATGNFASADTAVQLEPEAAPDGTQAVYDRVLNAATGERETRVISLKPGEVPFGAGEGARFQGASLDGEGAAFKANGKLYLRYDNEETFEIGEGVDFAGLAEGGTRIFYVQGGDLMAFDAQAEAVVEFTETGDAVPVQVALGGSAAYFVSQTAIAGSGPNPNSDEPQGGAQNLYLSQEGQISFVGTVTDRDVEGKGPVDGLGLWVDAIGPPSPAGQLANVPARTTPDGDVLLFKSRAVLDDYDPEGHAQIYRYDSLAGELQCLSCNPTGAAASSDARLQSRDREGRALFAPHVWLENLRSDGRRAFFESSEALVAGDSDGLQDVYEWEEEGVGSCTRPGGCLYLISSGQSGRDEYLWAVSESGNDVFFLSSDLLVPGDPDETPSIYDARVGGGFPPPPPPAGECLGEACQPVAVAPEEPAPAFQGAGNVVPKSSKPRCRKGRRAVRRRGKVRCLPKKGAKRPQQSRARANRRAGR